MTSDSAMLDFKESQAPRVGFITNCLKMPFIKKVKLAKQLVFNTLEVACWPKGHPKQCDIDADHFDVTTIKNVQNLLQQTGVSISCLAYYDNLLSADLTIRHNNQKHLKHVIDLASALGVPYVGTYVGRDLNHSIADNFSMCADTFPSLVTYAANHHVTILIENCPMPTWDPEGFPATITYTPELWEELFHIIPDEHLALNFDPSHLYWMHIDYLAAANQFADRIKSVHVKDVTTINNDLGRYGIYGKKVDKKHRYDYGYYQATVPGYGDINWLQLFRVLQDHHYRGPYEVEYKNGNGFGVILDDQKGLRMSSHYVRDMLGLAKITS